MSTPTRSRKRSVRQARSVVVPSVISSRCLSKTLDRIRYPTSVVLGILSSFVVSGCTRTQGDYCTALTDALCKRVSDCALIGTPGFCRKMFAAGCCQGAACAEVAPATAKEIGACTSAIDTMTCGELSSGDFPVQCEGLQGRSESERRYDEVVSYWTAKKYDLAIMSYMSIRKDSPFRARAQKLYDESRRLERERQLQLALRAQAWEYCSDARLHAQAAVDLLDDDDDSQANAVLTSCNSKRPQHHRPPADAVSTLKRAQRAYDSGDYAKAIEYALKVSNRAPSDAWRIVGESRCAVFDAEGAMEGFKYLTENDAAALKQACTRLSEDFPFISPKP